LRTARRNIPATPSVSYAFRAVVHVPRWRMRRLFGNYLF
jgi:hypothetical protein